MSEFRLSFHLFGFHIIISNISNFRGALEFTLLTYLVEFHGINPSPSNTFSNNVRIQQIIIFNYNSVSHSKLFNLINV
jgi:hypothetical protein